MYPFGPDDDFPDEFCAIRQGSGEHWFYTPVGESASWMLFRAEVENAKLRELAARAWLLFIEHGAVHPSELPEVDAVRDELRELGIDADGVTIARLRSDRTAQRVIVADGDTDCATGHCVCGGCGGAIDCWDRFCKHCGRELED
jgi:hypothetical protein